MTLLPEVVEHFSKMKRYTNRRSPRLYCPSRKSTYRVLEIGCGANFSFDTCSEKFSIDITRDLIKKMKKMYPEVNLVLGDARYLPFKEKSFDTVGAVFVLHHLVGRTISTCKDNVKKCISEANRVTTNKGQFIVLEHLSLNKTYSNIMFLTTLLLAKLNLNIKYLDIQERVVTYYLDEKTLNNLAPMFNSTVLTSKIWRFRGITLGYDKQIRLSK